MDATKKAVRNVADAAKSGDGAANSSNSAADATGLTNAAQAIKQKIHDATADKRL